MSEITARLSTVLADRYKIERHLGEGGMVDIVLPNNVAFIDLEVTRGKLAGEVRTWARI